MRYINIEKIETKITTKWKQDAKEALDNIKILSPEKRSEAITKKSKIWSDIKHLLETLSNSKCWYCEARQTRSDKAVDHFRPKNEVDECSNHSGYWWLAFDWKNYRLSCTYCNSRRKDKQRNKTGGKADSFPLFDETARAYKPEDKINLETCILLDPTVSTDPILLSFNEDGTPVPVYTTSQNPNFHTRAEQSIKLYHLDHSDLVEDRRSLATRIRKNVLDGEQFYTSFQQGDNNAKLAFSRIVEELIQMIQHESQYSSAARTYLGGYRNREWVDYIFSHA